jgi:uncharacterized protein YggE
MLLMLMLPVQDPAPPGLTVVAAGTSKVAPAGLLFSFQIEAKGDDIVRALEALDKIRASKLEALKALGVAESDVKPRTPEVKGTGEEEQDMRRRIASHRLKKGKGDGKAEKEPVTVAQMLTAKLPLAKKEGAAMLIEAETLKEKVKAAKLPVKVEEEEATEEEEGQATPDLVFLYYAAADPQATREAAAQAMAKAKKAAEVGAQCAGKTLGAPKSILVRAEDAAMNPYEMYEYRRYGGRSLPTMDEETLTAGDPEGLKVAVMLQVTFELK